MAIPNYKIDAVMNLVYEYSRIMDGIMTKEGQPRKDARSAATFKDKEIRQAIKMLGLPRHLQPQKENHDEPQTPSAA